MIFGGTGPNVATNRLPRNRSSGREDQPFDYTVGSRRFFGAGARRSEYNGTQAAPYRWGAYLRTDNPATTITNPIILVDGFDLNDYWYDWDGIYDEAEVLTVRSLYKALDETDDGSLGLASTLRSMGYDVVIIDYKDSQDFIQRNGLAVADAIEDVQDLMAPDAAIPAVIGLSMGGLTARYALLTLEAEGGHRVERYISFDSPQQGANVPVSLQFAVDKLDWIAQWAPFGIGNPLGYYHALFDTPAFRQLVYYNIFTETADPLRADLFAEFDGRYPTQTLLNAAIANGGSGIAQKRFDDNSGRRLDPYFEMVSFAMGIQMFGSSSNESTLFRTGVVYDFDLMSAPNAVQSERAVFKAEPQVCVLGLCGESPVGGTFGDVTYSNEFDSAPGSWRDSAADLPLPAFPFPELLEITSKPYVDSELHTFIPTLSALDYVPANRTRESLQAVRYRDQNFFYDVLGDVSGGSEAWKSRTPFDAIYFEGHPDYANPTNDNFTHVFNPQPGAVDFLFQQLASDGTPPPAPDPAPGLAIGGPDRLEPGTTGTWTALNASGATNLRWDYYLTFSSCGGGGGGPIGLEGAGQTEPGEPSASGPPGGGVGTNEVPCAQWHLGGYGSSFSRRVSTESTLRLRLTATQSGSINTVYKFVHFGSGTGEPGLEASSLRKGSLAAASAVSDLPTVFALSGAAPNPFREVTTLALSLPETASVRVEVYNTLGQRVALLASGELAPGRHPVRFDGSGLPSGVYLIRTQAEGSTDGFHETTAITLAR